MHFLRKVGRFFLFIVYRVFCGIVVMFWPKSVVIFSKTGGTRFFSIGIARPAAIRLLYLTATTGAKDAFGKKKVPLAEIVNVLPTVKITERKTSQLDQADLANGIVYLSTKSYRILVAAKHDPVKGNISCTLI